MRFRFVQLSTDTAYKKGIEKLWELIYLEKTM